MLPSHLEKPLIFGIGIFGFIAVKTFPEILLPLAIILLLPYAIGEWLAEKMKPKVKYLSFLVWGNTIGWIIPPLGMLVGGYTSKKTRETKAMWALKRNKVLVIFGPILSLINGLSGMLVSIDWKTYIEVISERLN